MNILNKIIGFFKKSPKTTLGLEKVGETFKYRGKTFKVVADDPTLGICDCAFFNKPCCLKFECLAAERPDRTSVHYKIIENDQAKK